MERKPSPPAPHAVPDDPDAPFTEEEAAAAARLREALEDPAASHAEAELLRALSLAHAPRPLDGEDHRAIVERALDAKPRGKVIRVVFGAVTAFSAAAAVIALGIGLGQSTRPSAAVSSSSLAAPLVTPLVPAHSTQDLFPEPFAKPLSRGAASARIDRIAMARGSDLRENRFASWGVR